MEKIDIVLKAVTAISLLLIAIFLMQIHDQLSQQTRLISALLNAVGTRNM
ncbi:hypothetical protein [Priestia koreensis]